MPTSSLDFMRTIGAEREQDSTISSVDLFMSHEGFVRFNGRTLARL